MAHAAAPARRRRRFDELPWSTVVRVAVCVGLLSIGVFLAAVALAPRLLGWNGTTVATGSMEPRISVGDMALTSPIDPDELVAGQVIGFEDPAGLSQDPILHRIIEVNEDGTFTTKGDANESPDSTPVPPENVIGIGRILVPAVGKPVVWLHNGDHFAFGLFAVVSAVLIRGAVPLPVGLGHPGRRARRAIEIATATVVVLAGGYLVFVHGTGSGNADFTTDTGAGSTWAAGTWEEPPAECRVRWGMNGPNPARGHIIVYNDTAADVAPEWVLEWTFTADQTVSLSPDGGAVTQEGPYVRYTAASWMGVIFANGYNSVQTVTIYSEERLADQPPTNLLLNGKPCDLI